MGGAMAWTKGTASLLSAAWNIEADVWTMSRRLLAVWQLAVEEAISEEVEGDCEGGGRRRREADDCLWKALTNALTAGYRTSLADAASHTTETIKRGLQAKLNPQQAWVCLGLDDLKTFKTWHDMAGFLKC